MRTTHPPPTTALQFGADAVQGQLVYAACLSAAFKLARAIAAAPFDALRFQHASAVRAGFIRNSILESRDFEQALGALERTSLGPLARCV
jgi:hypothetical protein